MAEKRRVLSHKVQSGDATMRVELKMDGEELTLSAVASIDLAFCIRVAGHRHCFEVTQSFRTLLRIHRGECTAYLTKAGHNIDIPIDDVLPTLRAVDLPLLWPEAETAISEFLSGC